MSSPSESEKHIMEAESDVEYKIEADDSESEEEELGFGEEELESEEEKLESLDEDLEHESEHEDGPEDADEGSDQKNNEDFDCEDKNESLNLLEKYEKRKSLYVRFPIPRLNDPVTIEKMLRSSCTGIIDVHRPRGKYIRFCLVDFDNSKDRNNAMKKLKMIAVNGTNLQVVVNKARFQGYVEYLNQKNDLALGTANLTSHRIMATKSNNSRHTSIIVVHNIPSETTIKDIRKLFPEAVDIHLKSSHRNLDTVIATVRMATIWDATCVVNKSKKCGYKIGKNNLTLHYEVDRKDGNHSKSFVENRQKPWVKTMKHKLEHSSTNDSSSPKKRQIHLKKENDEENQEELMGQNGKVQDQSSTGKLSSLKKKQIHLKKGNDEQNQEELKGQNEKVEAKFDWFHLKEALSNKWVKKTNKPEKKLKKANKLEKKLKRKEKKEEKNANKPEHQFMEPNNSEIPFIKTRSQSKKYGEEP